MFCTASSNSTTKISGPWEKRKQYFKPQTSLYPITVLTALFQRLNVSDKISVEISAIIIIGFKDLRIVQLLVLELSSIWT